MSLIKGKIWLILLVLAIVAFALGAVFVVQGVTKTAWMSDAMRTEQVTLGLSNESIAEGNFVDSAAEAQQAGDTIREHRHSIAPTYNDLLAGGRFNASDPVQLTYAQAMNMENYLYLAVLGFGVAQMALGTGVFMLVVAIALGITSLVLRKKRPE
ncbi:MAG: hypothetical protein WC455_07865 [Dehalococcoidia bacterium]|jgi:hypothetical protein